MLGPQIRSKMFIMHQNQKSGPPKRRKPSINNSNAWRIQWALFNATEIKWRRTCVTSRLKTWTCQMQVSNVTLPTIDARCMVKHFWSSYTHFTLMWPFQFSQQMCNLHTRHEINTSLPRHISHFKCCIYKVTKCIQYVHFSMQAVWSWFAPGQFCWFTWRSDKFSHERERKQFWWCCQLSRICYH